MIPAVRVICFTILLSAFSFRAAAEDFTNAIHVSAEPVFPGVNWERETNGLSPETFREVDAYVHTLDTTGLMVMKNGRVIYEHGDVKRLSYLASARKSVLSMLYGPYVASGKIRLEATLKDLDMSDVRGLLPIEEHAKVIDLITARSGVYHPAANGGDSLFVAPKRGSKEPGACWLYSNWDFNAAGAAFEQMTGKNIYDALRDDLAIPIGMQDFDRERQQKSGDMTRSQYSAYHLVLSTRDMARLGLLMLRQGQWRDRQIIPAEWVRRSTSVRTPLAEMQPAETRAGPFGYGYMWWVWDGPFATGPYQGAYTALGAFGQYITILPALDMIVAHKTWPAGNVSLKEYLRLLDLLTGKKPASAAELALWERVPGFYDSYAGQYQLSRRFTLATQVLWERLETHKTRAGIVVGAGLLILSPLLRKTGFRKRCLVFASVVAICGLLFCLTAWALGRLAKPSTLGVRRDGNRLLIRGSTPSKTGRTEFNLQPKSETNFLASAAGVPVTFHRDTQGKVTRLTARIDGKHDWSFEKFSDQPPAAPACQKGHIAIKLDPHIYDAYAGRYSMAPDARLAGTDIITIKRDGDALIGQKFIGQNPRRFDEEYFPESETDFFNTTEDEQLTFVKNDRGEVTGVIVYQNGMFGDFGRKEYKVEK